MVDGSLPISRASQLSIRKSALRLPTDGESLTATRIVKYVGPFLNPREAFLWDNGKLTNLGFLPGGTASVPQALNQHGQVVGNGNSPTGSRAILWDKGTLRDLGTLPGVLGQFPFSGANDISNSGTIVGLSDHPSGFRRAVLWTPHGTIIDLGLPSDRGVGNTRAQDINQRGEIVGDYQSGQGEVRGLLWRDGQVLSLPAVRAGEGHLAIAINNPGDIVGQGFVGPQEYGILWSDGIGYDLNQLIDPSDELAPHVHLLFATSINDRGQIGALGLFREAANVRKTNASVWYKGCTDRPLATTEARA